MCVTEKKRNKLLTNEARRRRNTSSELPKIQSYWRGLG
jgi:hypothetical protein